MTVDIVDLSLQENDRDNNRFFLASSTINLLSVFGGKKGGEEKIALQERFFFEFNNISEINLIDRGMFVSATQLCFYDSSNYCENGIFVTFTI